MAHIRRKFVEALRAVPASMRNASVATEVSYLQAQFHRLRARRGTKKAIIAVAASMLAAAWHMLRNGTEYRDLGTAHFERADAHKAATCLIHHP